MIYYIIPFVLTTFGLTNFVFVVCCPGTGKENKFVISLYICTKISQKICPGKNQVKGFLLIPWCLGKGPTPDTLKGADSLLHILRYVKEAFFHWLHSHWIR